MKALTNLAERRVDALDLLEDSEGGSYINVEMSDGSVKAVAIMYIMGKTLLELAGNIMCEMNEFAISCMDGHTFESLSNMRVFVLMDDFKPEISVHPDTGRYCVGVGAVCPRDGLKVVGRYA